MFLIGVVGPTVVTVLIFILFLVCWFKFNWKEKFFEKFMKPKPSLVRGRINEDKMEPNMLYRNHIEEIEGGVFTQHHIQRISAQEATPIDGNENASNMYEPVEIPGHKIHDNNVQYLPIWTNNTSEHTLCNNDDSSGYMSPLSRSMSDLNDLSLDTSVHNNLDSIVHSYNMNLQVETSQNIHNNNITTELLEKSYSQNGSGLNNSNCSNISFGDKSSSENGNQGNHDYGHIVSISAEDSPTKSQNIHPSDQKTKYICTDYSEFIKIQVIPNGQTIKGFDV